MLDLDNRTGWSAGIYPGWGCTGGHQLTIVFKAGFSFDGQGRLQPLDQPLPLEETDRYRGKPGQSSLAAACETVPYKQGGEILLHATAQAPGQGRAVAEVSAGLRCGDDSFWEKTLRIFGPRIWNSGLLGASPGKPAHLEPVPIIYENAYGGADPNHPEKLYAPNPVGKGFSAKGWRIGRLALPQIEVAPHFITSPAQRVPPAGFGPLACLWEPRLKNFAEVEEKALLSGGSPFGANPPADLWNAAPLDQRFPAPFAGGESLLLKGLVADGGEQGIMLHLPIVQPALRLVFGQRVRPLNPVCDTLLVDCHRRQLALVWRAAVPWRLSETKKGWAVLRDATEEPAGRFPEPAGV